jgi:hypothetical protein
MANGAWSFATLVPFATVVPPHWAPHMDNASLVGTPMASVVAPFATVASLATVAPRLVNNDSLGGALVVAVVAPFATVVEMAGS